MAPSTRPSFLLPRAVHCGGAPPSTPHSAWRVPMDQNCNTVVSRKSRAKPSKQIQTQDLLQRDMLHVSGVGNVSGVRKQLVDGVITGLTKNRSEEPGHGTTRTERRSEPRNTRTERNGTKFQRSATTSRTTGRIIMEMTGHKL